MLAVMYHAGLEEYDFGAGHPLRGDRFRIFPDFLKKTLAANGHYRFLSGDPVGDEDLRLICTQEYIDFTREYYRAAHLGLETAPLGRFARFHSMDNLPPGKPGKVGEAARLIIGLEKRACGLVMAGDYQKALCFGGMHHAKPGYGEGFCIYNDVAFTARHLIEKYGLERVLVLDTDAHAGNGTAEYFYQSDRVLLIDIHQDPRTLYPGTGFASETGSGPGLGYTVNIPVPVGAGDLSYELVFDELVAPIVQKFQPQIIIRNGGSDPHFADSLTNLGLTTSGFNMIGRKVRELAEVCGGRSVDILGSGYNLAVLPYAWMSLVAGLADFKVDIEEPVAGAAPDRTVAQTKKVIEEVKKNLRKIPKYFE
ncbi:MAG: histone deacetylase [Chloroflexota bacterium]